MIALFWLLLVILASPFNSKRQLEAENVALRHQVVVLRRQLRGWVRFTNLDRLFLVRLYCWFPSILGVRSTGDGHSLAACARWHIDGGAEGQRHHRPNTWDGHQPPAHLIVLDDGQQSAVQDASP